MEKLRAVVKIEHILVAGFDIDCEAAGADRVGISYRKIRGIIGLEDRRVAFPADQLVGTGIAARVEHQADRRNGCAR